MGPNYFKHPIFILYWVALKKKIPLKKWAEDIESMYKTPMMFPKTPEPLLVAKEFVEKYSK